MKLKFSNLIFCALLISMCSISCGGSTDSQAGATPTEGVNRVEDVGLTPVREQIIILAKTNLCDRLGLSIKEIKLQEIEAVEWPDASLGCPLSGRVYAQVITPGFRLVLEAEERLYVYHTDEKETIVLCEVDTSTAEPLGDNEVSVDDGWPNQPLGNDVVITPPTERK